MDWHSSERLDTFRYTAVDRQTLNDTVVLDDIQDGGSISFNSLTALKVSASVPYLEQLELKNDFLRIYSISELHGESETVVHGTFIASTPDSVLTDAAVTGTAQLYSLLLLLQRRRVGTALTVEAGTNAVAFAASLVRSVGLPVVSDSSSASLNLPKAYDGGLTYLEVVNDLLQFAGFKSLGIDGWGNALMQAYRDPSEVTPSVTFRAGPGSTFAPQVSHTLDIFEVPNRLTLVCSRPDQAPLVAVAQNDDPENRYSTVSRGEVIDAEPEEVDDIPSLKALQELAKAKLAAKTSAVESLAITHSYEPFSMDDGCLVEYAGLRFQGIIVSSDISLSPGMLTGTKVRRFVRF